LENRKPILQAGKTEDIEKMAKEWASIIKNKEARKDAEDAARIILEHGIKLPRLLKKKGGKTSGAEYRAPMFEGDDGILYFNELRERDYKSYKEKKMQYRSGAQDNTFLHELGHHIDALLEPKAYSMVEHQWNMEKVNRELIEKELSRYALENRAEFEAELISATLRGKTFSKELLSYSNLHNPEQNEGIAKTLLQYASGKDICTPVDLVREKFDRMMKVLFRQEGASLEIGILASEEAQDFIETHSSVLNGSFRQVEMSEAMRKRLERSNYVFSGLKTFHELNEAFPSLLDENGNRKTFERFLNDVRKIDETYNSNYLRAEFNFVQASAEMAAKWERFMQDGDRYYLQYRTAGDAKVRPTHAEMAGITLPASDPFWEEFYPPNGWGCRCSVVQVRKSKYPATDHEEAMARGESALELDKKGMFRFNAGMEQKTMPDYNPYTIKRCKDCDIAKGKLKLAFVPDNELCAACKLLQKCVGDKDKSQRAIERTHYLHEMEPLLQKKVEKTVNGKNMNIGFTKDGNKHLFSDTFGRTRIVSKEELKNLDSYLERAEYVDDSALTHPRTDNVEHYYYFKVRINGKWARLNVAKEVHRQPNGKVQIKYFLYSINDIKE
jgi:SPP1 gp7 family putative phage head morphogenesis protein